MRAAVILGMGCSSRDLKPFQADTSQADNQRTEKIEWRIVTSGGMPVASDKADVVLLFGGDGTIHRHLNALVKLNRPVLIVPAGSGNDFARALGLRSVRDSLAAWRKFCGRAGGRATGWVNNVRQIDLGVIFPTENPATENPATETKAITSSARPIDQNKDQDLAITRGTYFASIAGIGLDAEVMRRANRLPRWLRGHGGYLFSAAPAILTFAPLPMKIGVADASETQSSTSQNWICRDWTSKSDQPTVLAAFANTPFYGGGMRIAPQAKMDDGLLDVCVVGGVDPFKLFCMFPTVYFGRHLKIRDVSYFHAPRVRVETEHPVGVYADGEYVCQTPVEIGVERGALKVIVP